MAKSLAAQLPSMQDACRLLASEIMGFEPEEVTVSEDGMTVTCVLPDGEKLVEPLHEFLASLAQFARDAVES